jgi:uncharacterized Tic20 family protein
MGYCVSCAKDVKTGKFCPTCGRQLLTTTELKAEASAAEQPAASVMGKSNLAIWAHAAPLLGSATIPIIWITAFALWLPPLLIRSSRSATDFDKRHATESLNFQITLALYIVACLSVGFATIGLAFLIVGPFLIALGVAAVIFNILGAVAANAGREYRYPLSIRLIK